MKPGQQERLDALADQLVTPERFFVSPVVHELPKLALIQGMQSLPGNRWAHPEPPEAA